jgi:hypothetical protein
VPLGDESSPTEWWGDLDRLLAALPPTLFRQVKLLEYDLALRYSQAGQFHDVFRGVDQPPVLSVATWLLDDLDIPSGAARDATERRLFRASVLLAARVGTVEGLRDPGGFTTDDRVGLVQWLSERASAEFARVVPSTSSFWEAHAAIAAEEANRLAAVFEPNPAADPVDEPEALPASPFSAPLRLVAVAALAAVERDELASRVAEMLDGVARAYQVIADLASMQRDLQLGLVTYPTAVIARAAHIALRPAPRPEVILGAMAVTGSLGPILDAAAGRLRSARETAIELHLPTFSAFLSEAAAHVEARLAGSTIGQPGHGTVRTASAVRRSTPILPQALAMARAFLLADPTHRESWEMHREGMLGRAEVASRFPVGLILEILCRHGMEVTDRIDAFLDFTVGNGFRYYDHPRSGIDSDTIGIFLRLRPHGTPNRDHDGPLNRVLACLERNVEEADAIPVWVNGCEGNAARAPDIVALGEGCGTVAAHLLLGVVPLRSQGAATVTVGAGNLLERIGSIGLAANVNYPPLYALGVFLRLVRLLEDPKSHAALKSVDVARKVLAAEVERAVSIGPRTAQDAALLMVSCLEAQREDLIDQAWLVRVLKQQRFDGSWIGEPFAAAPNRGRSVSWYSSTLLTTALCYDALAREANRLGAATD